MIADTGYAAISTKDILFQDNQAWIRNVLGGYPKD